VRDYRKARADAFARAWYKNWKDMNSQNYLWEITRYLAWFTSQVKLENQVGNFDINKYSESFLIPLLNVAFKKEFERLEFIKVNYQAIDLRSKDKEISIQVTAEKGFGKIKETLSGFISSKLYEGSKLIHFVIDESYKTKKTNEDISQFVKEEVDKLELLEIPHIDFTSSDIWNISILRKEIEKNASLDQLSATRDFLMSQYGEVNALSTSNEVLIPYQTAFEPQINPNSQDSPFQFNNLFFGRKDELDSLTDFITSENEKILTIVSDGGYGKTRLCIESFQKITDELSDTEAFVLNEKAFHGQIFRNHQKPIKTTIILVDDAHKKTEILNSLLLAANGYKNVKLILTVRKALYEDTLKEFPTHSRNIPSVPLKRLSYDDTLLLIQSQILGVNEIERKRLAGQSKGVPIVILGLCHVIKSGKYSSAISEEGNFIRFVLELKDQVVSDIATRYYVDKTSINKLIQLLSLLGPIKNTEDEVRILAGLNSISYEECSLLLSYLEEHEFVQQKGSISILSDPYSDVILLDMASRIKFILKEKGIGRFMDRVIRNLAQVEHSERLKLNVDSIVIEFISSISKNPLKTYQEIEALNNNLETLKHFTYRKPLIVFRAIELLLKITDGNHSFWQKDSYEWDSIRVNETHDHIDTIISILTLNIYDEGDLSRVLSLIQECVKRRSDFNLLVKAFRYREYDFIEYRYNPKVPCGRQIFLIKKLKEMITASVLSDFDGRFILSGATTLLNLDFGMEESYDKFKHTISYGTANVIDNETTRRIRNDATEILISLFKKTRNTDIGEQTYEAIVRKLHFTVKTEKENRYLIDQSSQVDLVGNFLLELVNNQPSFDERAKLLHRLRIYSRREIKPEYSELIQKLVIGAESSNSNKERIEILLREEYFFKRIHLEEQLKKTILAYKDWNTFYEDAITIYKNFKKAEVHNINDLIAYLITSHPDRSKELFEFICETYPDLRVDFCELVKANYKDKAYFYSKIEMLWAIGNENAVQAVVYLLTMGRNREKEQYEIGDLAYIEHAIDQNNQSALLRLSVVLPDFMYLNLDYTLMLCKKFIDSDTGRNTTMLINALFENPKYIAMVDIDKLKQFAFDNTAHLEIEPHYFSFIFIFLERNFGFEVLFSFLLKRIDSIEKAVGLHAIDFGVYGNPDLSEDQKEQNFIKAIEWFISVKDPSEYVHLKVVAFFAPSGIFTDSLREKLSTLLEKHHHSIDNLLRICGALDIYEEKNMGLLGFLISIGNKIVSLDGYKKDKLTSVFGLHIVLNMGSKVKSGPGPYPQDIDRRELLLAAIAEYKTERDVREVLDYALENVKRSIEDEEKKIQGEW
jgi:hypothetical protein